MQVMPKTLAISQMGKNPAVVAPMLKEGPVIVTSRAEQLGVLVDIEQWNRTAIELENLRLLVESQRIAARNDANGSWVDGSVVEERMKRLRALED